MFLNIRNNDLFPIEDMVQEAANNITNNIKTKLISKFLPFVDGSRYTGPGIDKDIIDIFLRSVEVKIDGTTRDFTVKFDDKYDHWYGGMPQDFKDLVNKLIIESLTEDLSYV